MKAVFKLTKLMNKFDEPDTYKMKKQKFQSDHDDLKWWEVPFVLLFVLALYLLVNVVDWFTNPIRRGLFVSALIGFILSVCLILFTAIMWSL